MELKRGRVLIKAKAGLAGTFNLGEGDRGSFANSFGEKLSLQKLNRNAKIIMKIFNKNNILLVLEKSCFFQNKMNLILKIFWILHEH
jgi:hypothetical protein